MNKLIHLKLYPGYIKKWAWTYWMETYIHVQTYYPSRHD